MAETETGCQSVAPGDQAERVRNATRALVELRDLVRGLGPVPPGPDRDELHAALNEFALTAVGAFSPPKKPRKPRRGKTSITTGWIGGG